jgi:hypothetical protein
MSFWICYENDEADKFLFVFNLNTNLRFLFFTMGNKSVKEQVNLESTHPNFKSAKVLTEKEVRSIKTTIPSDDEGYNAWKKLLTRDQKILDNSHFLLLPKKHTYNKSGLCSHSGNVEVSFLLNLRSTTSTFLTFSQNKSQTDNKNSKDSENLIFGICCTVWSVPLRKSAKLATELAISDLKMCSLTSMAKSRSDPCTHTRTRIPITRSQLTKK